jgi:flagellin-specific chaperone FliS
MALDSNALSSISTSLDELTDRIGQLLAEASTDDEAAAEVREVERQLQKASRRLAKALRKLN